MAIQLAANLIVAIVLYEGLTSPVVPERSIVEWISDTYVPGQYCPGDVIEYEIALKVSEPVTIELNDTFLRSGPDGDTVLANTSGDVLVFNIPTSRTIADRDARFTVPNLPPGDYVRSLSVGTRWRNTQPIFRQQPFTIRGDCS